MDKKDIIIIGAGGYDVNMLELTKILENIGYETMTIEEATQKQLISNNNIPNFKLDDIKHLIKDKRMSQNNDLWYQSKKFKKPKY